MVCAPGGGEESGVPTTSAQLDVRIAMTKTAVGIATRPKIAPSPLAIVSSRFGPI
jgi:hypothetical protein